LGGALLEMENREREGAVMLQNQEAKTGSVKCGVSTRTKKRLKGDPAATSLGVENDGEGMRKVSKSIKHRQRKIRYLRRHTFETKGVGGRERAAGIGIWQVGF